MSATKVDDRTFQETVLDADVPVLVDFWAPWCGPCRAMGGVVDELAGELGERARVVKVNVDEANQTAHEFGVQSIPTFAVVNGGQVTERLVGVVAKDRLLAALEPHLD